MSIKHNDSTAWPLTGQPKRKRIYNWTTRQYEEITVIELGVNPRTAIHLPKGYYSGMGADTQPRRNTNRRRAGRPL